MADVSHELRTPITNLKLYANLIQQGIPDKRNHYLSVLDAQINRLTALVEDTLTLARLETGDDAIQWDAVDLGLLVQGCMTAYQNQAEKKGVALDVDIAPHLPVIQADAQKVDLLLQHIMTNALNYTHEGRIYCHLYATPDPRSDLPDQAEAGLCIEIADTGIGIEKSDMAHVFERFYRGYGDYQGDIAGTGLGLPIVRIVTNLHGGHVQAESDLHKGSTFRVWLPLTPPTTKIN